MVRVVLDTNIWISAIVFKGKLTVLIDHWEEKKLATIFSPYTFDEFQEKLLLWGKMLKKEEEMLQQILSIKANSMFVYPKKHFNLCKDENDNMFLDATVEGKADYLVSGDKKLLALKVIEGIPILTPSIFIEHLQL